MSISEKYHVNVYGIRNILVDLKDGRVSEITEANCHGSLYNKACRIEELLNDLIRKIDNDEISDTERLSKVKPSYLVNK